MDQHHATCGCDAIVLESVLGLGYCGWCCQLEVLSKFCVLLQHLFLRVEEEGSRLGLGDESVCEGPLQSAAINGTRESEKCHGVLTALLFFLAGFGASSSRSILGATSWYVGEIRR